MIDWTWLKTFPLLAACSDDALRRLAGFCAAAAYRRFQDVYREGQPPAKVCFVRRGKVVLHKLTAESDRSFRIYVAEPGEVFGIGEMMLPAYYTSATAIADTALIEVRSADFVRHFLALPPVRDAILRDLSRMLRIHIDRMVEHSGVHELALYLWHLARDHGRLERGTIRIQTRVRQPEAAAVLNLSREHVTRLFRKLKQQGVVDFNHGFPLIDSAWLNAAVRDKDLAESIRYRTAPF